MEVFFQQQHTGSLPADVYLPSCKEVCNKENSRCLQAGYSQVAAGCLGFCGYCQCGALSMSLLGAKTKSTSLIVFNRVLVAGWELTWVLSALLSNTLQAAQKRRLQLQQLQLHPLQLHPCCIKEEDRISQ